ncbi:MAG: DNA-binding protein [Candidatus Methanofastidiosia archaeon]|jgi:DNA-binding TFAR19-related protein (PDSD5 family)
MDDIEEIRRKKAEEMRKRQEEMQQQQEEEQAALQQEMQKQVILKQILDTKARERLTRIKMANPQYGEQIEAVLFQLLQAGRIKQKLDEDQFKQLIHQVFGSRKREFNIERR